MKPVFDFAVIGGGLVGLATALALQRRFPKATLVVLEKEGHWGAHQSGHNSGVIHSGIYYRPGSYKARLCKQGREALLRFCKEQGIPYRICGKLIVASKESEIEQLFLLASRAMENGIPAYLISSEEAKEWEPHVQCHRALRVETTGVVDFSVVCAGYARVAAQRGAELHLNTRLRYLHSEGPNLLLGTDREEFRCRFLINCAGLQSDRVARMAGLRPPARILPFRGEYFVLQGKSAECVHALIYPVPDPKFPFLGVHLTRSLDNEVHAGPNAVLSFKREGYAKTAFSIRDTWECFTYKGFWQLVRRYAKEGLHEMMRSYNPSLFAHSVQQLVPDIHPSDLLPNGAGVRAQAVSRDGNLVDDFLLLEASNAIHVCNAPSPAATASLAIGEEIAQRVPNL